MKLFCAIVGEAGGAFEMDIDEVASVSTLKDTVKETIRNKLKGVAAADLKLFLAKRNKKNDTNEQEEEKGDEKEKWLTQDEAQKSVRDTSGYTLLRVPGAELRDVGLASDQLGEVSEEDAAVGLGPVHVLVLVPRQTFTGKRTREQDWFVDDEISKKRKVNGGDIRYFNMDKFPLMAHSMEKFKEIMERDAYRVIIADLMRRVKKSMKIPSSANLIVTGNSGTGKSRFYLYCIFQLLLGNGMEVKELPAFDLVLNFDNDYQLYDAQTKEFVRLNEEEVHELRYQQRVLRLVEGRSSHLVGWNGVSIVFACPGLDGMNDYAKVNTCRYIMPMWTFEEIQDCNSLLDVRFKLTEDVLVARYNKFGGNPRFIFTDSDVEAENEAELRKAITTFNASKIISFVKENHPVKDENYLDRVLAMVPSKPDFRTNYYLDFSSNYVAEKIVSKAFNNRVREVSEFAIAEAVDDSGCASVRGTMHEKLCHKWFELPKQRTLQLRSLSSQTDREITLEKMKTIRFLSLDDIKAPQQNTYYWPTSQIFGAILDAFFVIGNDCFGLKMTRNQNQGIQAAPLNTFLTWLKSVGIAQDHFNFVFVVPSHWAGSFKKQTIRTTTDTVTPRLGNSANVSQYVAALDVFMENHFVANKSEDAWRYQLQSGFLIDAQDTDQKWYESRVVELNSTHVKIHFRGWTSRWDEWMKRTSSRIAPRHTMVPNWRDFKVGDSVMVGRQVSTKKCPEWRNATVTACNNSSWRQIETDVDGSKQWMRVQDEMLCPPGTHKAVN